MPEDTASATQWLDTSQGRIRVATVLMPFAGISFLWFIGVVHVFVPGRGPYAFNGTVHEVVFDLKPAHHEAEVALHEHAAIQAVGQGAAG
jgi:hypothetical protein